MDLLDEMWSDVCWGRQTWNLKRIQEQMVPWHHRAPAWPATVADTVSCPCISRNLGCPIRLGLHSAIRVVAFRCPSYIPILSDGDQYIAVATAYCLVMGGRSLRVIIPCMRKTSSSCSDDSLFVNVNFQCCGCSPSIGFGSSICVEPPIVNMYMGLHITWTFSRFSCLRVDRCRVRIFLQLSSAVP